MAEERKKQDAGKIKDQILNRTSSGKPKKKLVIKKKPETRKRDISEHFRSDSPRPAQRSGSPGARSGPGGPPRGGSGGQGQSGGRPPRRPHGGPGGGGRGGPPQQGQGQEPRRGPISSALRGQAPRPGTDSRQRRSGPGGRSPLGSATPFDQAIAEGVTPTRRSSVTGPRGGGAARGAGGPGSGPAAGGGGPRGGGGPGGQYGRREEGKKAENQKFFRSPEKKRQAAVSAVPKEIEIMESIQVGDLARKLNLKPSEIIGKLMKMGEMVTINKTIDAETATLVAAEYNCQVKVVSLYDETVIKEEDDAEAERMKRPPVVTIMGHVDHGKTRLLDTIRKTNVIAGEAGAITQHIGAYQVKMAQGAITFLDTPGHEAFTAMRARGAAVTDIVVLVVAADDGVKTQTIEAITHAKEAGVPIIVAVNKVDLPTADVPRVKSELAGHGLQAEDMGGDTVFCEISAKQNIGIDHLLEMILLQADLLDLKANPAMRAVGRVVEARIDAGKGPVATVLIQKGTLHDGDPYVVGVFSGRVRAMFDDLGRRIQEAGPSMPVEISGIDGVPEAGDPFTSVENEKYGREVADKRQHYKQITESALRTHPSLGDLKSWMSDHKEIKLIIKADVQGSVEAIRDGLEKISTEDVKVRVVHGATGAISESDVNLASASDAIVIGFQVRATPRAADLAEQEHVDIKYYSIIYDVMRDVHQAMEGMLEPDKVEEITGRAEIREVFKISRIGNVAGCMVTSGKIRRNQQVRVIRDSVVLHTGTFKALRRHKDDVQEVAEGFECGISLEGFNDIQVGDQLEAFEVKEVARKL